MSADNSQSIDGGVDYLVPNYPSAISRASSLPSSVSGAYTRQQSFSENKEFFQSFIFPDLKAVDFLRCEFPPGLAVVDKVKLTGYEIYIVEQWALDRKVGTVITTYTGDPNDEVTAYAVVLTRDESEWPLSFKTYLGELFESAYARLNNTDSGSIFITNLGQLTDLILIPVPNGDIGEVWELFLVNENLKRLGCGSRSALGLVTPSKTAEDKFKQMFRVHSDVPINYASIELVMIVQVCLYYFDLLNPIYGDGLLCNKTIDAIDSWWHQFGSRYLKPYSKRHDTLNPMTVAGIIGMVLIVRARLDVVGNNVVAPKDPLNAEKFRLAIGQFQKYSNKVGSLQSFATPAIGFVSSTNHDKEALPVMLKLNSPTIDKLIEATIPKNSQTLKNDLLKVKRIFKNTVSDFSSGKTLQTLNIASPVYNVGEDGQFGLTFDEECLNLDTVVQYIQGKRMLYLWKGRGKPVDLDSVRISNITLREITKAVHQRVHSDQQSHSGSDRKSIPEDKILRTDSLTNTKSNGLLTNGLPYAKKSVSAHMTKTRSNTLIDRGSFTDLSNTDGYPSSYNGSVAKLERVKSKRNKGIDATFYSRLNRRFSCPISPEDLSLPIIGNRRESSELRKQSSVFFSPRDELDNPNISALSRAGKLRRTKSFSLVESAVHIWNYPFTPSAEWIAKRYLVVKAQYEDEFLKSDYLFRESWKQCQSCVKSNYTNNPLEKVSLNHILSSQHLQDMRESVVKSQQLLEAKATDIELLNSRLKYELRLLTMKVKDVEQNLMQLRKFKMKGLVESMNYCEARYGSKELNVPSVTEIQAEEGPLMALLLYIYAMVLCTISSIWFRIVPEVNSERLSSSWHKVDPNGRLAAYFERLNRRITKHPNVQVEPSEPICSLEPSESVKT